MRLDDSSISGDVVLLRALPFEGWYKFDGDRIRVSSIAFIDNLSGEVSCYLDSAARRSELSINRFPGCFMARFTVDQARNSGFNAAFDPDGDPDHSREHIVLTFGRNDASRKEVQRAAKTLAICCEVIPPSNS